MAAEARTKVLAGAYECIVREGTTRPTIDEIARASGVSRASIYRWFPGGRDEVIQAAVGWEVDNFFLRLAAKLGDPPDFPSYLEAALPVARHDLLDHAVLHRMLEREPAEVSTLLAFQQEHMVELVGLAFRPRLERDEAAGLLAAGTEPAAAADYVARMALSLLAEPGRHDLDDPAEVGRLVRHELLGGIYR
ncbi:MAG: TetR/AcrR family transcriptional regulator [Acidimicrobiia bacterium]